MACDAPIQWDGLPGPSHHYGGLAVGNVASAASEGQASAPRAALHQCCDKMALVAGLGVPQYWLPPVMRPDWDLLRAAGFRGTAAAMLQAAADTAPVLLRAAWSSAAMWTANLGTVVPAGDGAGRRHRLLVANLAATTHRAREARPRFEQLRYLLDPQTWELLPPLPQLPALADEGAANHHRLPGGHHCFVVGRDAGAPPSRRYPARVSATAAHAVARCLGLDPDRVVVIAQHPAAIDAGAFHNDVVMVGEGNRLLIHAQAWWDQARVLDDLRRRCPDLRIAEVASTDLDLETAVASYLFNSQLLCTDQGWVLVAPVECASGPARRVVERLEADGFVDRVSFVDLRQSMQGGGGPACLRLRLPADHAAPPDALRIDGSSLAELRAWADRHYRESLSLKDLADPQLVDECQRAGDDLARRFALRQEMLP